MDKITNITGTKSNDQATPFDCCREVDDDPEKKSNYFNKLVKSSSIEDFRSRILEEVMSLGFSDFWFVQFNKISLNQKELYSVPPGLTQTYYENELYKFDEREQYARNNVRSVLLSDLVQLAINAPYQTDTTKTTQTIYELHNRFGFFDFFHTPITSKVNHMSKSMLSVSQKGLDPIKFKDLITDKEITLRVLAQAIDDVGIKKFPEHFFCEIKEPSKIITPKALRMLEVFANSDLSINQVADKLCVSVVTAQQHIAAARRALGVRNNQAAVKRGILMGLIKYTES